MMMVKISNMMSSYATEATGAGVELNWPHYRPNGTDAIVSSLKSTEAINKGLSFKY